MADIFDPNYLSSLQGLTSTTDPTTNYDTVQQNLDWMNANSSGSTGILGVNKTYNDNSDPYATERAQDIAGLDTQIGYLQSLLGRADTTLNQGLTQIGDSYNKELARGNENQSRTLRDYATKEYDTQKDRERGVGEVDRNAYTLANSLRRMIGMASGRGSSAYQFAAPQAVAQKASTERGNVLETTGKNMRNINTARQDAITQFENYLKDLEEQRKDKEYELKSGITAQKQDYQYRMGQAQGEKARVGGAGYNGIRAAMQPYLDAISAGDRELNSLFTASQTAYTPKAISYQVPELGKYTVDRAEVNANRQFGGTDPASPYSYFARKKFSEAA